MKQLQLKQGSPEWHAHRATHDNASDAPAMMGCSPYTTRSELLHCRATGITPEVDAPTQRRFDDGHRYEALARPLGEEIIGEELYPVVGYEGSQSASFDGLTMMEDKAWEHKSLNDELRSVLPADGVGDESVGASLPLMYRVQMEQQAGISDCVRVLFTASKWQGEALVEARHCWYRPDLELRAQIAAGWAQFHADLADYVPPEITTKVIATPVESLPAVSVRMSGDLVVASNLPDFATALREFVAKIPAKPSTDQEFADAEAACKSLKRAEEALDAAETNALAQMSDVETMRRLVADCKNVARTARLNSEKAVAARKEQIKVEIVAEGRDALAAHIAGLNQRLGKAYMPAVSADFGGAIKGKKTVESLRDAMQTELARAKIEASAIADKIQINLATLVDLASEHKFLFADAGQIVLKAADDLTMLVKSRIAEHQAAEQKRADELAEKAREKIRAEEAEKLAAEAARKEREEAAAKAAEAARLQREKEAEAPTAIAELATSIKQEIASVLGVNQASAGASEDRAATEVAARMAVRQPIHPAAAALRNETPTLTLGAMRDRLGFAVTADFLAELGFEATAVKAARLYRESEFGDICNALIRHIEAVCAEVAEAA